MTNGEEFCLEERKLLFGKKKLQVAINALQGTLFYNCNSHQMDPNWKRRGQPQDCLSCLLCKAVITFEKKDKRKYVNHMKKDHGAFYNINLVLIINLLEREKVLKLIDNIKNDVTSEKKTMVDAAVQTEIKPEDNELLLQLLQLQMSNNVNDASAESDESSVISDVDLPTSDIELEEALPTPNMTSTIKREFIEPNPNLTPVELELEDDEDFNILDVTNDDMVLTAGGPIPLQDYSNFNPGSIVQKDYGTSNSNVSINNQFQSNIEPTDKENDNTEATSTDCDTKEAAHAKNDNMDETSSKNGKTEAARSKKRKIDKKESELIIEYLKSESEYFKTHPKELISTTEERASKFTEIDSTLPDGWKARSIARKNGRKDWEFLSPEMKMFRSRVGVVEYMRTMGGYSYEEMSRVCPAMKIKREKQ